MDIITHARNLRWPRGKRADINFGTATATGLSIWAQVVPPDAAVFQSTDTQATTVGTTFFVTSPVTVYYCQYYYGAGWAAGVPTQTGLFDLNGNLLAFGAVSLATAVGWNQVQLNGPVQLQPNTGYVTAVYYPNGGYPLDWGYFAQSPHINSPFDAPVDNSAFGHNGRVTFATGMTFPV